MTLCLVLEHGSDPAHGPDLHQRIVTRPQFTWLEPPRERGRLTVATLADAPSARYTPAAWAWARDIWRAWEPHHETVRRWIAESLS